MAATTSGSLKAYIESLGLGVSAYRDRAPAGQTMPYVSILEAISTVPDPLEDGGAGAQTVAETAQVDVWQVWRDPSTDALTESYTLVPSILRALQGAQLTAAPGRVYGCRVRNSIRIVEHDNNLVHDAITVALARTL